MTSQSDLDVFAGDTGRAGGRAVSQGLAVLLDVDDSGATDTNAAAAALSRGTGEADSAEVSKLDHGAALLEVLNDPLGVGLAEISLGALVLERVRHLLAGGVVLDGCSACGLAGGRDSHGDGVTG